MWQKKRYACDDLILFIAYTPTLTYVCVCVCVCIWTDCHDNRDIQHVVTYLFHDMIGCRFLCITIYKLLLLFIHYDVVNADRVFVISNIISSSSGQAVDS